MSRCRPADPQVAGFVLAGGQSSRMGRDKALLELGGESLVSRAVHLLQTAGFTVSIAGAHSELEHLAPVCPDVTPGLGPLSGICSGLDSMTTDLGVFIPVDLPFLPVSLLKFLVRHAHTSGIAVTLASVNGFTQTFPAVIRRDALPILRDELSAGRSGCFKAFCVASARLQQPVNIIAAEIVLQSGQIAHPTGVPPYRWFANLNTPADLERARSGIA